MAKLSRGLFAVAVLLVAGGAAAYLTRDQWRGSAPAWVQAYLPPPASNADAATPAAGQQRGGGRGGRRGSFDNGPIPVLVSAAQTADVPVTLEGVGTVKAFNTVTITPQVSGQIVELPFQEGQFVKKGDVIARIDDSTYKAALDQAIAKRAQDQALLDNAKIDLKRYEGLAATNSVTKQTADTQRATVAQNEAQLQSDDAAIASAKATLAYTVITAPIDARAGIRNVDVGNVVQAGNTTGIVTLSQMNPISVLFSVPQQSLADIVAAHAAGPLQVQALAGDDRTVIDTGTLDVIDSTVDSTTGTIRLKANFANGAEVLWPGAFVNARLQVKMLKGVIVVPTAAVQRGPNGTFLYVLGEGDKAQLRTVTVGQQGDQQTVIDTGLKAGEKVITTGFARLSDGAKVEVTAPGDSGAPAPDGSAAKATDAPTGKRNSSDRPPTDASGQRQHKGGGGRHRQQDQGASQPPGNAGGNGGDSATRPAP